MSFRAARGGYADLWPPIFCLEGLIMSVAKVIEITSTPEKSFEDSIAKGSRFGPLADIFASSATSAPIAVYLTGVLLAN
jgi:hypothetical protein